MVMFGRTSLPLFLLLLSLVVVGVASAFTPNNLRTQHKRSMLGRKDAFIAKKTPQEDEKNEKNYPPYTNPGSWLEFYSACCFGQDQSTSELLIALWDGKTGKNYSTSIGVNITFGNYMYAPLQRMLFFSTSPTYGTGGSTNVSWLNFYEYGPRSVPKPSTRYPTCLLPSYAQGAFPLVLNGHIFALNNRNLYTVALPMYSGGTCQLTHLTMLPLAFNSWAASTIGKDSISWTDSSTFAEMTVDKSGKVSFFTSSLPGAAHGTWIWMQQDLKTKDYYMYVTKSNYDSSFWNGTISKSAPSNTTSVMHWVNVTSLTNPWYFGLDSRHESAYGDGPLFCSADSTSTTYCVTRFDETVFNGPQLAIITEMSGGCSQTMYDPFCN